jgi:hypothetical protein
MESTDLVEIKSEIRHETFFPKILNVRSYYRLELVAIGCGASTIG